MQLPLGAREPDADGPQAGRRPGKVKRYRLGFLPQLRLPCRPCAGTGHLWVSDAIWPRGRAFRCTACRGTGVVRR